MDEKAAAKDGTLLKGGIHGDHRTRNDMEIVNIGGYADDAVRRGVNSRGELQHRIGPVDVPIEGILIGEHPLRESLADDHGGVVLLLDGIVESTSGEVGTDEP